MSEKPPIYVSFESETCERVAFDLATKLQIPLLPRDNAGPEASYVLCVTEHRLELRLGGKHGSKTKIYSEFLSGPQGYRRIQGGGLKQLIAKAVGLKSRNQNLTILDLTAGLGQDAFVLACLGCKLWLVERSPVIKALLQDGLHRAKQDPELGAMLNKSMQLIEGDAYEVLQGLSKDSIPDVIYLDPMFPERQKSALTKIEMRVIHDIVGEDEDAGELLLQALRIGAKRVVVKRPRVASPLAEISPNFVVRGQRNRYDVYLSLGQK